MSNCSLANIQWRRESLPPLPLLADNCAKGLFVTLSRGYQTSNLSHLAAFNQQASSLSPMGYGVHEWGSRGYEQGL